RLAQLPAHRRNRADGHEHPLRRADARGRHRARADAPGDIARRRAAGRLHSTGRARRHFDRSSRGTWGSGRRFRIWQERLDIPQPIVSQQLAKLRTSGIVSATKEATTVTYALADPMIGNLLKVAKEILNRRLVGAQALLRELRRDRGWPVGAAVKHP